MNYLFIYFQIYKFNLYIYIFLIYVLYFYIFRVKHVIMFLATSILLLFMMASTNREQPLARQTNVVHHESGCLKANSNVSPPGCCCDLMPSKPGLLERGMTEAKQPTCSLTCNVTKCESKCCMTCKHLVLGSSFSSNLTNKNYNIVNPNDTMDKILFPITLNNLNLITWF